LESWPAAFPIRVWDTRREQFLHLLDHLGMAGIAGQVVHFVWVFVVVKQHRPPAAFVPLGIPPVLGAHAAADELAARPYRERRMVPCDLRIIQ